MSRALTPAPSTLRAPRLRWVTALCLAVALLGAQGLGLWHRVVHGGHGWALARGVALPQPLELPALDGPVEGEAWPHVAGQADCQLLDDCLLADLQTVPALLLPLLPPQTPHWLAWVPRVVQGRPQRGYHARGPPAALQG